MPATPLTHHAFRHRLERWIPFARRHLHPLPQDPEQIPYGPAHHGHWAMQAHNTAFAVLAADPDTDERRATMSRGEMREIALRMLRFTLRSHVAGGSACTDGQPWGHT